MDKFVGRMLMEDKGNLLKEFRKETGCLVLVRTEREDTEGTLIVKGQAYKVRLEGAPVRHYWEGSQGWREGEQAGGVWIGQGTRGVV